MSSSRYPTYLTNKKNLFFAGLVLAVVVIGFVIPAVKFYRQIPNGKAEQRYRMVLKKNFVERRLSRDPYLIACNGQPNSLIVFLHSWSTDYQQIQTALPELSLMTDMCVVAPNFGGPYGKSGLAGSSKVLKTINDVIVYEKNRLHIQPNHINLMALSGGGYTALLYMSRYPKTIQKASIWFPIYDLAAWYNELATLDPRYQQDLIFTTGHPPKNELDPDYLLRSPKHTLDTIKGPLDVIINVGIFDGRPKHGTVPPHHSLEAAQHIKRACPSCDVLYKEFKGGHEFNSQEAMTQIDHPVSPISWFEKFWLVYTNGLHFSF